MTDRETLLALKERVESWRVRFAPRIWNCRQEKVGLWTDAQYRVFPLAYCKVCGCEYYAPKDWRPNETCFALSQQPVQDGDAG